MFAVMVMYEAYGYGPEGQSVCLFNYDDAAAGIIQGSQGWVPLNAAQSAVCGAIVTELSTTRACN
jgi:hypothetical protein